MSSVSHGGFTALKAEHELLLTCSRTHVDEQRRQRIKEILASPINWEELFIFGRRHGLLPLFYVQLSRIAAAEVPPIELARLKQHYQENAARNLLLTKELLRLIDSFAAAGIDAIPYKGPALADTAYGNLTYRRFLDLDVMVRKQHVVPACEVLLKAGYSTAVNWSDAQQELLLRTQHNLQFTREEQRLIVELHWEVTSELFARSLQAESLWERLEETRLQDVTVKALALEDLLLSLCVHGSKHLWERLSWICDIAELLTNQKEINWDVVLKRTASEEMSRMLGLGLLLANRLFDAPIPDAIHQKLKADSGLNGLVDDTCKRIVQRGDRELISVNENVRFNFQMREGWRSRLRYFRMIFRPTDADVAAVSLPGRLSFGYYLVRPFRFLRRK